MRTPPFAIALGLLAVSGCSKPKDEQPPPAAPVTEFRQAEKKPIDPAPLPPLAADPGGATGTPLQAIGFGGLWSDAPRGIAVADGEAYVVGYFEGEIDFGGTIGKRTAPSEDAKRQRSDAYLAKIGKDGALVWVQTWGDQRDDVARAVAVRGDQVVVAGHFLDRMTLGDLTKKSAGSDDAFVAAFSKTGEVQWVWNFGGIASDGANAIAAMPDGGWVIGGSFSASAAFGTAMFKSHGGTDAMLLRLAPTGEIEWARQFGGRYNDTIQHLAVDAQGNIIVQGVFMDVADWGGKDKLTGAGGKDNDVVLAKYDQNGDHLWSQRFGNAFDDVAGGVTVDPAGHITMTGSFDQSVSFGEGDQHTSAGESDVFVARFTPEGTLEWARTYGADRADIGNGIASDAAGNTVTTGWFEGTVDFGAGPLTSRGNKDVFALKLDRSGALVWAQRFGDKDHDQGRAVAVDETGAAYVAGIYRFKLDAVAPALDSTRAAGDRVPKPDTFVLKLAR